MQNSSECAGHPSTLLNNQESTKKNCLALWLTPSESSYFLVSEMLCFKILLIWLFEKNNFDHFLFSRFQLQNPIYETLLKFSVRGQVLWKIEKSIRPILWLYNIKILLPNLQKLFYLRLVYVSEVILMTISRLMLKKVKNIYKLQNWFYQKARSTRFWNIAFLKLENLGFPMVPITGQGNFFFGTFPVIK